MEITTLIESKKLGKHHSKEEINYIIKSYMAGIVSDAQIAAWLTAIGFKGMSAEETAFLAEALGKSGKIVSFGETKKVIVDKHSTGGVGNKVTITLIPLLAAAGIPVAKLAARGLGHAAGTVDKLESIPELNTNLSAEKIVKQVNEINAVIASQSDDLAPIDKKFYTMRYDIDAIRTEPLIVSSIISKKIASGATHIIIDVKYGIGTDIDTAEDAVRIANLIINVGKILEKSITVIITSMSEPLGRAVGNSIEVIEAIEFLKGNNVSDDLANLTFYIATKTLLQLNIYESEAEAEKFLKNLISSGKALEKFKELIQAQGGVVDVIDNYDKFTLPHFKVECESKKVGFVQSINAYNICQALEVLGASRIKDSKPIDLSVGIYLNKKSGEQVKKGDILYTIYSNNEETTKVAQKYCDEAFLISDTKPSPKNLVYKIVSTRDEDDDV